jgi:hypothetical protein
MYFRTLDELKNHVINSSFSPSEKLMVMVGDNSSHQVTEMMSYLNELNICFFGGIFPELIIGNESKKEGFIIEKLQPIYSSLVLPFMMEFSQDINALRGATAIIFIDGLSRRMKDLTTTVFNMLGTSVTYVGGGAGFYDLKHRPCIFNNDQLCEDALYICIVSNETKLALEHGWKVMSGPFYVKRSYDNVISQLDSYKAFDVYRHVIEEEENLTLFKDDFFIYAKDHPFGILEEDGSIIVRDPIEVNDDDEIICIAGIPEGSEVYILRGNTNALLDSSKQISQVCRDCTPEKYYLLLFNCISRAMFLGKYFSDELNNIQANLDHTVEGVLSIGEIATRKNGHLVIHNKSTVLAIMKL